MLGLIDSVYFYCRENWNTQRKSVALIYPTKMKAFLMHATEKLRNSGFRRVERSLPPAITLHIHHEKQTIYEAIVLKAGAPEPRGETG